MASSSKAKVLIVESLSPDDLIEGRKEARAAADVLTTLGVGSLAQEVKSLSELENAVKIFVNGSFDVLHIACHGCCDGLGLTNGERVGWAKLVDLIGPAVAGRTLVVSACEGGCQSLPSIFAASPNRPKAIVGPHKTVPWDSLVIGLLVYYRSVYPNGGAVTPDSPCVAVSRAELAAGTGLVLHLWNSIDKRYDVFEPNPVCSIEVMIQAHGDVAVQIASLYIPHCCGNKWIGADQVLADLKKKGVNLSSSDGASKILGFRPVDIADSNALV